MSKFKSFRCGECGGTVELRPPSGEVREFRRGFSMTIPSDVLIPKCGKCGEVYFGPDDAARVDAELLRRHRVHQSETIRRALERIRVAFPDATQAEIEDACRITRTYLSHLVSGRRLASPMLVTLLEVLGNQPSEFARLAKRQVPAETARAGVQVDWVIGQIKSDAGVRTPTGAGVDSWLVLRRQIAGNMKKVFAMDRWPIKLGPDLTAIKPPSPNPTPTGQKAPVYTWLEAPREDLH